MAVIRAKVSTAVMLMQLKLRVKQFTISATKTEMELASFTSLKARNVIPSEAEFVFTTPLSDVKVFNVTVAKINAI